MRPAFSSESRITRLALLLILFAFPAFAAGPYPVVRVVDGDTIVVRIDGHHRKVRLIGVDTPETVDRRKPVHFFGRKASAFTRKLLEGESVVMEFDQQRQDRYGRVLAYVYRLRDGLLVNREIIAAGFGHALIKYPHAKMDDFLAAEREARKAGRGLWSR